MRIYQVDDYYHIDLEKLVAIRQIIERTKTKDRRNNAVYKCWIEATIDSGRNIIIECSNIEKLFETYDMLLKAWQTYAGDIQESTLELP